MSWRHWVYGIAWIARQEQRDLLVGAQTLRLGQMPKEDFDAWSRDIALTTGVPHDG